MSTAEDEFDWRSVCNEEAIVYFMRQYGEDIKRLVFTFVKNREQAEDITQDVFVTLYTKLDTFRGDSAVKSWIYTIAINRSRDYLRTWYHRKISFTDKIIPMINVSPTTAEDDVIQMSEHKLLADAVLELPVKYREIVILYYYKQLTLKEISVLLNVNERTLKTRIVRGRKKLQEIYEKKGGRE